MTDDRRFEPVAGAPGGAYRHYHGGRLFDGPFRAAVNEERGRIFDREMRGRAIASLFDLAGGPRRAA